MPADLGAKYYYVRNAQGDIVQIRDSEYGVVANYHYDAWGKLLSITDAQGNRLTDEEHVAVLNPLRYRGYVYDSETGFYYLNSRYYDPEVKRFINADTTDVLGADGSSLSYNLFAYCMNDPINRTDDGGCFSWKNIVKVAVGVVATAAAVAVTVATGGAAAPVLAGVAASTVGGAAVSAVNHRITTGSWNGAGKAAIDGAADGFMWGGIGALGGSLISAGKTVSAAKSASPANQTLRKSATSKLRSRQTQSIGAPFDSRRTSQIGVDPNTLQLDPNFTPNPAKYKAALNQIKNSGMYGVIDVQRSGMVINGQHRVYIARKLRIAVDIAIH